MMPNVLVTGFGVFPGVDDNPTERLVRAIDGAIVGGHRVHGRVLPVEYHAGPAAALRWARELDARLVLGTGVASRRAGATWELRGAWWPVGKEDAAGHTDTGLVGPREVQSTLPASAALFGAKNSVDAGGYVCNAWLYQVASQLQVPVGFLHVPAGGYPSHRLLTALAAQLSSPA